MSSRPGEAKQAPPGFRVVENSKPGALRVGMTMALDGWDKMLKPEEVVSFDSFRIDMRYVREEDASAHAVAAYTGPLWALVRQFDAGSYLILEAL